ncbi:MAG: monofunctional biosynthetic peptidoglycan transglycosylase [Candidatus Margulisbacteria bacterium]|nr:monofunctional biosynthetic peptidoglycan transglycosylase [Candidatus Margulisiibacteriota bacterium]
MLQYPVMNFKQLLKKFAEIIKNILIKLGLIVKKHWVRSFVGLILLIVVPPILYSFWLAPYMGKYRFSDPVSTSFMKYRAAQTFEKYHGYNISYKFVPLSQISKNLIKAVIFAEDINFYQHHGLDMQALQRSIQANLRRKKMAQGGSTITMQLCKNMFLSPKKTYFRKLTEIFLTIRMESALSKERIIELYLNVIEWGRGIYGAENAARYYFDKSAVDLDEEEAAYLAAIIVGPYVAQNEKNSAFFEDRQDWIYQYLLTGIVQGQDKRREQYKPEWLFAAPSVNLHLPVTVSEDRFQLELDDELLLENGENLEATKNNLIRLK